MTVRFILEQSDLELVVRVEGRLTMHELEELECIVASHPSRTALELHELRSADPDALCFLRRLRAEGVSLRSVPPRVELELEE